MDIFTNFYATWGSASLEIQKITQFCVLTLLVLRFLKHGLLRLTFSIFLASLFTPSYFIYQFSHLTGKDSSKLIDNFNTEHYAM